MRELQNKWLGDVSFSMTLKDEVYLLEKENVKFIKLSKEAKNNGAIKFKHSCKRILENLDSLREALQNFVYS